MAPMYVAEPDVIDVDMVAETLQKAKLTPIPGDTGFNGSHDKDYETILIRSNTTIDGTIREHFPRLKNVIRVGTGLDNVDLAFCKANNLEVYNAAGANADTVAEYVICMTLYVLRKIHKLTNGDIQSWNRFKFEGASLAEQTIGIVGFGNVGKAIYKKLSGFTDIRFLAYDPYLTQDKLANYNVALVTLPKLLEQSSIVSLHLPLTAETEHLINAEKLSQMQDNVILINAARGGIVDEQAVLSALAKRSLTYVADVVENEPHPRPELLTNENVIITPHIASLTDASERAMITTAIDNFLRGKSITP